MILKVNSLPKKGEKVIFELIWSVKYITAEYSKERNYFSQRQTLKTACLTRQVLKVYCKLLLTRLELIDY